MESKYDYVVFDIETTGLHPDSDQICEIAAIGVKDGLPQGLFSTLVAIEGSMPEAAGRVNGITDDMLKGAPAIGDALDAFLDFIGEDAVLAGHNIASFDIPFVANAAAKSGRVFIYPYVIDTLEAARELWPDLPSRSMDSLRGILGIERRDAHRALADCYDELAVLNAELSVIMQSYTRKMDYCRGWHGHRLQLGGLGAGRGAVALVRHRRVPDLGYGRRRGRGLPVRQALPREAGDGCRRRLLRLPCRGGLRQRIDGAHEAPA